MEKTPENIIFAYKKDPILDLLNQNSNPLKNEDFIKGSLDGFDKFFSEEENVRESKNPINYFILIIHQLIIFLYQVKIFITNPMKRLLMEEKIKFIFMI